MIEINGCSPNLIHCWNRGKCKATFVMPRVKFEEFYQNKKCTYVFPPWSHVLYIQLITHQGLGSSKKKIVQCFVNFRFFNHERPIRDFESMWSFLEFLKFKHGPRKCWCDINASWPKMAKPFQMVVMQTKKLGVHIVNFMIVLQWKPCMHWFFHTKIFLYLREKVTFYLMATKFSFFSKCSNDYIWQEFHYQMVIF